MRGFPMCITGTIPTCKPGYFTTVDDFILSLRRNIVRYQSNGQPAWEVFTGSIDLPYTGSVTNTRITTFKSVGDRTLGSGSLIGDANIYIQIFQSVSINAGTGLATLSFVTCQDFSQVNNSGTNYNISGNNTLITFNLYPQTKIDYMLIFDEYEINLLINNSYSTKTYFVGAGQLTRIYPPQLNGVARIASGTTGTGTVVIQLDRDIRGTGSIPACRVGQKVWLVKQTPSGSALSVPPLSEIVHVSDITSNTITVTGVVNQPYHSGSLVGYDPQPLYSVRLLGDGTTASTFTTTRVNGTSVSALGSTSHTAQMNALVGNSQDTDGPNFDGSFRISPIRILNNVASFYGYRGYLGFMKMAPYGFYGQGAKLIFNYATGTEAVSSSYLGMAEFGGFSLGDPLFGPCVITGAI